MEYVDGPSLAKKMRSGLTGHECAWLALSLMRGAQAFHQLDIIHCDLKPQNVLIEKVDWETPSDPDWVPRIIDFGLAVLDRKDADGCETAVGRVAGTPAYMAPEQVNGWMLSPACDVYAIGLILWEAVSGRAAFSGDTYTIMAAKASQTAGLRPEAGLETGQVRVPSGVADLVERCTHPHPAHRPTAAAAIEELEKFVS